MSGHGGACSFSARARMFQALLCSDIPDINIFVHTKCSNQFSAMLRFQRGVFRNGMCANKICSDKNIEKNSPKRGKKASIIYIVMYISIIFI